MKTRTKLFIVHIFALSILLLILFFTYYKWYKDQKNLIYQSNLYIATYFSNFINQQPLNAQELKTLIDSSNLNVSTKKDIYIFDKNNYPIYQSSATLQTKSISAFAKVPKNQWSIYVVSRQSEAYQTIISEIKRQLPVIVTLFTILIFVLPYLFYRWIISPIVYLSNVTKIIAEGQFNKPIITKSKGIIGVLGSNLESMRIEIVKQLSDLKQSKEEEEKIRKRYEAILSGINEGVFAIDKNQKIFIFNTEAEKISGYQKSEAIGKNYKSILTFGYREDLTANYQFIDRAINNDGITKMEGHAVVIGKNVKVVSIDASASPLKDSKNHVIGAIVVFRDITEQMQLENIKEDFFRICSHELKTPMSIIKGYVDMILEGDTGPISEQTREYLNDIIPVIQRQIVLVNDLLQVSQFESSSIPIDLKLISISQVIKNIVADIQTTANEKGLQIVVDKGLNISLPSVQADPNKVRLILNNFIGNAIKFTIKGKITLKVLKKDSSGLIIFVTDTGIGIPKDMQPYLFKKFSQVGNVLKRRSGGTGLGLYISKYLAQKMGGDAWLEESAVGKGSTFAFSIPVAGSLEAKTAKKQIDKEIGTRNKLSKITIGTGSLRPATSS